MKKLVLIALGLVAGYGAIAQSANDAGVNAISTPTSPVLLGVSQPVSVTVKNYGTAALTSASLGFSVNGVMQPTFAWTGSVAANATSAAVTIGNFTFPAGNHTVKAWSKLPNGIAEANAVNDTTTINISTCTVMSGNYTINKNAAASATNFISISAAAQALANCGVSGPVTLTVAPNSGIYTELVTLAEIPGASAINTITFEGNGNTLTAVTSSTKPGVITFNGADFVKVNNFNINVDIATGYGWGIQLINASDNDIITNCTINLPISSTAAIFSGIVVGTVSPVVGNFANNLLVQNNTINAGGYGIFMNGTTTTTSLPGNRFIGNKIKDSYLAGIQINNATSGTLIEGNDISRPSRIITGTTFHGIYLAGSTLNTVVNKNRIHNTHDMAATITGTVNGIYAVSISSPGNETIIKNNLIYNINAFGSSFNAFYNSNANGVYYYHNTVSLDNPAITYATVRGLNMLGTTTTNVKFYNNILSLASPAAAKHAIYLNAASLVLLSNNNDLYVGNSGKIGFLATDKATLADWKATNSNAYDQNSISVDPLFVSATYLQPLAPAVNNAGQSVPAVTDAINGVTRSITTPDPGAYEFTPAVNDAGLTAILSPTVPVAPAVSQPVQVTLKNFGSAALTAATISWKVNGVAQPDYTWSGNLSTLQATSAPVTIGNYTFPAGNLTVKIWSKNPNGTADGLAVNDTITLNVLACAPMAGTYTINKNNPTAGTNFQSINDAVARLTSCGVSAPVTLTVTSGTGPYNEQVEIMNIPNTSATNTVTFEGSGNTVSATTGIRPGVFVLNGSKNVKLNNFVITTPTTATVGWGVQLINGADNNTISNSTINLSITTLSSELNGIMAAAAISAAGNNASNTKILNNTIVGGWHGIQLNGNTNGTGANNNQIVNNQFKDQHAFPVYINNANGTLIEGNDMSRMTRTIGSNYQAVTLIGATQNTIVNKNRIHNTHDAQSTTSPNSFYFIYNSALAIGGSENIVKNNVVYNIKNPGGSFYGVYAAGTCGSYYHNTIVSDAGTNYNFLRGISLTTAALNHVFVNNIVSLNFGSSTVATKVHGVHIAGPIVTLVSNNNNIHLGGAGNIGFYSTDKATLADWKAANNNAYDQNSVSADPVFTNYVTGDLKPTPATIDNLGQPLTTVTDDILGAARSNTTPDFGAYEFGTAANDVGILNIAVSNASNCKTTATDSVTVTIKNYGNSIQTSIPLTYSLNGTVIPTPETFTGSIAPNATAIYTFSTKVNLATAGTYQIIAKTMLPGDVDPANNSDTILVTNAVIPGMPVVFNFETLNTGTFRMCKTVNAKSAVKEGVAASNGTGSTKGLILDGVDHAGWVTPAGTVDPWTTNPDNFAATHFFIAPAGGAATDSLIMSFDLKQLFKTASENTNFRVTINGTQVGPTYRPVSGTNNWQKVKVDLTQYKNDPTVQISFESSVKEAYDNGSGTANLIDNILIKRVAGPTAVKDATFAAQLNVFPNPSNGIFNIDIPKGKTYELQVTDLTGKVLMKQTARGGYSQLNLEGTAKGIYLLKISGENSIAVRKLILE